MPSARMKEAWWVFMSESKQEQEAIASEALRVNQLFAELEVAEQHSLQELQQAQQDRDEQVARVKALEAEVVNRMAQLDAFASEKDSAIQTADDLKQQLAAQLRSKDQALQAASASNSDLSNQLQERSQELETANKKLTEAQGEAELTLLRLNQVQEELEKYFLRSRAGDELSQAQALENARAMGLLGRMIRLQAPGL